MSHEDLERRLRSEPSRHDSGYHAVPLPASLVARERTPRVGRLAILLTTVVAGAATAMIVIALLGAPAESPVGQEPVATPLPIASPESGVPSATPSGTGACAGPDLAVTAERWGGAAGSRGTTLSIAPAGAQACRLPAQLEVRMTTVDGGLLISGLSSGPAGGMLPLDAETRYALGVAWSNWCGERPDGAHLELRLRPADAWIAVETPAGSTDPVPPCLGSGEPTSLSLTELEAQPAP
ncbi:MAG: hypothetical protein ABI534_08370 [Chloroflexota bacterium]